MPDDERTAECDICGFACSGEDAIRGYTHEVATDLATYTFCVDHKSAEIAAWIKKEEANAKT